MGKKNRVPEPEESAFESAKAAFDRVGEDYAPTSKAVELSKTEEPAETPVDAVPASDTDNAEAVTGTDADATPDAESVEAADGDANGVEAADSNAESVETESDADVSEAAAPEASVETPEAPVSEAAETPEKSEPAESETTVAEPVESGAAPEEAVSEAATSDSDATPEESVSEAATSESDATPETPVDNDATPEVSADSGATPEPEAVEEEEPDDSDDFWTFDADEPESEEVTEMEKLTMETKEITLGVHRSPSVEADTEAREQEKKTKFYTKAFDRLKDALRTHADSTEHVEHADDSTPPSGGSSRDAAIRKRVMQIEDEETRNYLLDRVLPQMTWYSKKSANYQKKYHQLMTAAICLGALIPVFSVWANNAAFKVILAFLGASVTAVNAYLALYKYQELWIAYRSAREELIHTLYSYFNKAGVFAQKKMTEQELNVLLVEVCENALSKENGGWTTTILQKTS